MHPFDIKSFIRFGERIGFFLFFSIKTIVLEVYAVTAVFVFHCGKETVSLWGRKGTERKL